MPASSTPVPVGEGSLPTAEFADLLIHKSYQGTVSLEWEKAWYPEAANLDVALASVRTWIDKHWDEDSK
jgi:sugar phosphate isomerase/epimerase